ncbi:MAG: hypothetical protein A4E28_02820 [Methanocella sp. PtaU1.Bin125]|nr:MAG: hypothetical protein A4E28_02820 [Methanocella sp. PtaU1.Bin125]
MDRIIINVVDKKTEFVKRIVIETNSKLSNCDFITVGEEIMFDKDTDFLTFGIDVTGHTNQLAIVTGEGHEKQGQALYDAILSELKGKYIVVNQDEAQIWLREY